MDRNSFLKGYWNITSAEHISNHRNLWWGNFKPWSLLDQDEFKPIPHLISDPRNSLQKKTVTETSLLVWQNSEQKTKHMVDKLFNVEQSNMKIHIYVWKNKWSEDIRNDNESWYMKEKGKWKGKKKQKEQESLKRNTLFFFISFFRNRPSKRSHLK